MKKEHPFLTFHIETTTDPVRYGRPASNARTDLSPKLEERNNQGDDYATSEDAHEVFPRVSLVF
jgi:hypothetical protein